MRALLLCLLAVLAGPAAADSSALVAAIEQHVRAATAQYGGEVRVAVDTRNAPKECAAPAPFTPPGSRLWGSSLVGVRCRGGGPSTVYVPVRVSIIGHYLVAARALPAGHRLTEQDLAVQSGDLAALRAPLVVDPAQAVGHQLASGLLPGQPLRLDRLRAPLVVQRNQPVRLVSGGPGFRVSGEGRALASAAEGQSVQVRTPAGTTVTGVARAGPVVEVGL